MNELGKRKHPNIHYKLIHYASHVKDFLPSIYNIFVLFWTIHLQLIIRKLVIIVKLCNEMHKIKSTTNLHRSVFKNLSQAKFRVQPRLQDINNIHPG